MLTAKVSLNQLAASIHLAMQLKPKIIHVVGYSEASYAATPEVVIESCHIAHGVVRSSLHGTPDSRIDPEVQERKDFLIREARVLLDALARMSTDPNPLVDPQVIVRGIRSGQLDAPHLKGSYHARGTIKTSIVDGACLAVDENGHPLTETERIEGLSLFSSPDKVGW